MTYLDKLAEQIRAYKVVIYQDHFLDPRNVRYFDDFDGAHAHFKSTIGKTYDANYTISVAIINVQTGEPIDRKTWRVV